VEQSKINFNKKIFKKIDSVETLYDGFEDIFELSKKCKFLNCTHTIEPDLCSQNSNFRRYSFRRKI
jgi:putative ribosome biogenesis GTPase RsgA